VATNKNGDIAVAGKRGFALYSVFSQRWRLFGDRGQVSVYLLCFFS